MSVLRNVILILSVSGLGSCASMQGYTNCDVHSSSNLPSLHPSAFGVNLISTQQIVIEAKENKFEFVSLLEINPYQLSLVALTPVGQKLFQLQYRKQNLDYSGQGVPSSFDPAFLLTDISLIYGKEVLLQQCFAQTQIAFSAKEKINNSDKSMKRSFLVSGTENITIKYSSQDVWVSDIDFTNHTRDYTIKIKSLAVERL